MPRKKTHRLPRAAAALAVLASLSLALSGCSSDTRTPASERSEAAAGPEAAAGAQVASGADAGRGAVDCAKAKCIALTFDAGPGKNTPELLDVLKEKKVHATFFLLGKNHVMKYPELVAREAREGHEVGNHTWTHKILTDQDADGIRDELARTQDAIARITGHRPRLMRPPQGRTDGDVQDVLRELGLSAVLWSTTAKDYATTDSALIRERTLDQAGRDGIILLHDIYPGTVPAVPGIIDELRKRGYTFVTVPQLMAPGHPRPGTVYRP